MNYRKNIVCLANSRKPGGRCVAGKEVVKGGYGKWIRPVSVRPTAEISLYERQYEDGGDPEILDIIDIPMMAAVPRVYQTENHMIDAENYWTKVGTLPWGEIDGLADTPPILWGNGDSTYHGSNDRITPTVASTYHNSLWLIRPTHIVERSFLARENGDYPITTSVYFCVSLAEAHTDNYCYKLVATVLSEQPL